MPEPNLPPLRLQLDAGISSNGNILSVPEIRKRMPEMPAVLRDRIVRDFDFPIELAFRFVNDLPVLNFFVEAATFKPDNVKVNYGAMCIDPRIVIFVSEAEAYQSTLRYYREVLLRRKAQYI
jgi:hypothetical protein